jgi:Domain of unknown function (DUF4852)
MKRPECPFCSQESFSMGPDRSELQRGDQVKRLAIKILFLALAAGFAPAMQQMQLPAVQRASAEAMSRPGVSPFLLGAALHPMTEETAFYYGVAISNHPESFVDDYARYFDGGISLPAMNDEFERARSRATIRTKLLAAVEKIDFHERFTFVCPVRLEAYSFSERAFPLEMDRGEGGFTYFSHFIGMYGVEVNPFVAGKPVNVSDIYWSLPMSEDEGSELIRSRPDRDVTMKVVYSVTRKQKMLGSRSYLVPLIESVEIFSDENMTRRLGVLNMAHRDEAREGL